MEDDNASSTGPHAKVVGVKSWLAYLGNLLLALILFGGVLPATYYFAGEIPAAIVLAVSAVIVLYQFLVIRSVQLYYDDVGVWVVSGVLPWDKGISGVKWRDMDEATFVQGFWSWITRSYDIRIGHRFTKSSEIILTNIAGGKNAIATLNTYHQNMIRDGVID
jgi:hypothetical protein